MAIISYLTLKGKLQGDIRGDVIQRSVEGQIAVYAYNHRVSSLDAAGGLSSINQIHKPLSVTKEVDRSTPLLYKALAQNELMAEFTLRLYAPNKLGSAGGSGNTYNHYTIKLLNAKVVSIETVMENIKTNNNPSLPILEQVMFSYESIEWRWMQSGVAFTDTWNG